MTLIKGYDISQFQGSAFNLAEAKRNGVRFVIIRASYGATSVDPELGRNVAAARANGLRVGFYHYAYPQSNLPAIEANHFWTTIQPHLRPGDLVPVLDFEESGQQGRAAWALQFLRAMQAHLGGTKPMFYSYMSFIQEMPNDAMKHLLGEFPLWLADYTSTPPSAPAPWLRWVIWQRANHDGTRHVDVDAAAVPLDSISWRPEVLYAEVSEGGHVVARIRYGGGRVLKYLGSQTFLNLLARGAATVRRVRRPQ